MAAEQTEKPNDSAKRVAKQPPAASAFDVAAYILARLGAMTTWKLQKLVYYSQAWSLVWDDRPLFEERIEAWANGPVCPALYSVHRGMYLIDTIGGNPGILDKDARETIDGVLDYYGDKGAQWLSDLTHAEAPWQQARRGLPPGVRGSEEITRESMVEYYSSL